jgi:hypothetical protein
MELCSEINKSSVYHLGIKRTGLFTVIRGNAYACGHLTRCVTRCVSNNEVTGAKDGAATKACASDLTLQGRWGYSANGVYAPIYF